MQKPGKNYQMLGLLLNAVHVHSMYTAINSIPPGYEKRPNSDTKKLPSAGHKQQLNSDLQNIEAYCRDIDIAMCHLNHLAGVQSSESVPNFSQLKSTRSGSHYGLTNDMLTPENNVISNSDSSLRKSNPDNLIASSENTLGKPWSFFGMGGMPVSVGEYRLFGHPVVTEESAIQKSEIGQFHTGWSSNSEQSADIYRKSPKIRSRGPENSYIPIDKELSNFADSEQQNLNSVGMEVKPFDPMYKGQNQFTHDFSNKKERVVYEYSGGPQAKVHITSRPSSSFTLHIQKLRVISDMLSQEGRHSAGDPFITYPPLLKKTQLKYHFQKPRSNVKSNLIVVLDVLGLLVACQTAYAIIPTNSNFLFVTQSSDFDAYCKIRPGAFELLEHINTEFQLVIMSSSSFHEVSRIINSISYLWNKYAKEQGWQPANRNLPSRAYGDMFGVVDQRNVKDLRILDRKSYKRVIVVDNQGNLCMLIISGQFKVEHSTLQWYFGANLEFR